MNLAIDIGNTRAKVGVFDGRKLVEKQTLASDLVTAYVNESSFEIDHVIISSVGNDVDTSAMHVRGLKMHLDEKTPVPVKNMYRTPETLGKDRLAAVVGAHRHYPENHVCVIDAGTCITYDVVTPDGVYLGGNISPGLTMRYDAMHHFTARLPSVARNDVGQLLGTTTEEALQNGGLIGVLMEIAGYIEICRKKFVSMVAVMTGGDAAYFAERLKTEIFVRPNLVLDGLNEILIMHVAKSN